MGLSIIILSYNVKGLLRNCLKSIKSNKYQIIVVDNNSSDGSVEMVKKEFSEAKLVKSYVNTGFAKGNNLAKPFVKNDVILFLNPDTVVKGNAIEHCLSILSKEPKLAAMTCRVELPNGQLDYSCHRGLPTVWNTFGYFTGIDKTGYTASNLSIQKPHDVDCITGAFMMVKKDVLDEIGWWDEDYWWNGDDVEICYKIKKAGYKIRFDPSEKIIHYKGSSSGLYYHSDISKKVTKETKIKAAKSGIKAMRIFVKKHWRELGPPPVMALVWLGIYLLEQYRLWKISH